MPCLYRRIFLFTANKCQPARKLQRYPWDNALTYACMQEDASTLVGELEESIAGLPEHEPSDEEWAPLYQYLSGLKVRCQAKEALFGSRFDWNLSSRLQLRSQQGHLVAVDRLDARGQSCHFHFSIHLRRPSPPAQNASP